MNYIHQQGSDDYLWFCFALTPAINHKKCPVNKAETPKKSKPEIVEYISKIQ
jgi:hypothetical protein